MNDTVRFLNHLSNIMEAGASELIGSAWLDLEDLVAFLAESDLRESAFWDGIYCDLREALKQLRDREEQDNPRRAFAKLSSISRRLWKEAGIEPLYSSRVGAGITV